VTDRRELSALLAPLGAWRSRWLPGVLALLGVAYALSGVQVVQPDEVALVLRMGRLQGEGAATVRQPGLLWSLPRPIDEVVRVRTKRVYELVVEDFHHGLAPGAADPWAAPVDPERMGYCLSADRNLVHAVLVARYRIDDPVAFALHHADPGGALRAAVMASAVVSVGEMPIDAVLSDGREALANRLLVRTQERLDAGRTGIALVAIELADLSPPPAVKEDFDRVQSAFIHAETRLEEARRYRESTVPAAEAAAGIALERARARASDRVAMARGDASAFLSLSGAAQTEGRSLRERLFREATERALSNAGDLRWVPPPTTGGYRGFRVSVPARGAAMREEPE
jgi:modulator of FtsH protease HflK